METCQKIHSQTLLFLEFSSYNVLTLQKGFLTDFDNIEKFTMFVDVMKGCI